MSGGGHDVGGGQGASFDTPARGALPSMRRGRWAYRVLREDRSRLLLVPKREVRQKLKVSPGGFDAGVLCRAGAVQKSNNAPLRMGGGRR